MIIENIKTAILWVLILSSIALTWLIWTYQPDYAELQEAGEGYVEIEEIGDTQNLSQVIHPTKVLIHNDENISLVNPGNDRYEELDELLASIEIDYMYQKDSAKHAPSLDRFYSGVEIVYSQAIKGEWLEELFSVEEENIPIELVDRIIFLENPSSSIGSEVLVQFVDSENEYIYESETSISVSQMEEFYDDTEDSQTPVEKRVFREREESYFQPVRYVTTEPITLKTFTYESRDLSSQAFSDILFSDPEFVRRYPQGGQEETFTDGNRMMTIQETGSSGSILQFDRPSVRVGEIVNLDPILEAGLDFVNGHSGWTDHYYADKWSETDLQDDVTFRLHVGGVPVFGSNMNDERFHTIEVKRRENQVTEYTRPMFQLEDEPFDKDTKVRIPPFEVVEQHIEENELFNMDAVDDIRIGHNMERERSFATFEPFWYAKVRGRWVQLDISFEADREVIESGLE
ncbi:YycH family regulatory protein [Salipaludibacillus daqingensis]|uniref:YycH family regulatory protein n=1 Tax=Salipaludibacillus daqingensis TaxID=3041001 RepID=UPI002473236A|nr:two-component system activity regulator YycH [Salipaludibacillus daqingensis]